MSDAEMRLGIQPFSNTAADLSFVVRGVKLLPERARHLMNPNDDYASQ